MAADRRPGGGGGGTGGLTASPGALAAAAAGFASAACALWAFRGLPLGVLTLWLAPLPMFLAGLGFGAGAAVAAALVAALLVALSTSGALPLLVFLLAFAVPVPLLVATALRGGGGGPGLNLSLPLVLLGVWPTAVLLLAALTASGEGGLEAALRRAVEGAMARMGVPGADPLVVGTAVRIKAAALGFWAGLALLANAAAAQSFLARRGLARATTPPPGALRLPGWYPALPAAGAVAFLAAPAGGDAVALSAMLLLAVPLFWLGIGGVHARLPRGRRGRAPLLAGFYLLLVLFLQLVAPAMVALGLFDHFRRGSAART
jgi:hypothetical protein